MINRPFWTSRISNAWKKRSLIWLSGVRRTGKTTISKMLEPDLYLNCDLPSVVRKLEDPELFFNTCPERSSIVFDEIHRLDDPSRILKIAADEYHGLKILATGSSTLAATKKFRDSLTGRKTALHLPPILWTECHKAFSIPDLDRRLLNGGLPEQMLSEIPDPQFFSEWLDSFYARDVQELFGIRERTGFLNLLKLMIRQSGGMVDYSALSRECDISRITVKSYLEAMTVSHALIPIPPFHGGGRRELVRRPKVYAFDTGFVCFMKSAEKIRPEERGYLWEHLVLDSIRASNKNGKLGFWRDKSGRELDFVISKDKEVDVYECKINPDRIDPGVLKIFRNFYPTGKNYVVSPGVKESYKISKKGLVMNIISCKELLKYA